VTNWRAALAAWFRPGRWSANDYIIAITAVALVVSLFVPWYKATVSINGSSVTGFLIQPPGTVSGIAVHGFLWLVFGLALLQFAVLAARYFPGRRALRLPGYRQFLVVTSGLSCIAVVVGFIWRPASWFTYNPLGDGFSIFVGWSYGAVVALAAVLVSLGSAVMAIRERPER
jgi:hypothetical protein